MHYVGTIQYRNSINTNRVRLLAVEAPSAGDAETFLLTRLKHGETLIDLCRDAGQTEPTRVFTLKDHQPGKHAALRR